MTILRGYFDDSHDGNNERFCAVGGLIGGNEQWAIFEKAWSVATYELKGPFHSTDCEAGRGCCDGWTVNRRNSLVRNLVRIIYETQLHGVGFVVPVGDYRAVFPRSEPFDPYFLALKQTIINMAHIGRDIDGLGRVDIEMTHEQGPQSRAVLRIFNELRAINKWSDRRFLKKLSHDDKRLTPLQGADLIAREAFKHADNRGVRPIRKPLNALKNLISFHLWTRDCLEYLRDIGGQEDLQALTSWGQTETKPPQMIRLWRDGYGTEKRSHGNDAGFVLDRSRGH